MRRRELRLESGQALVIGVFLMVGLLMMSGLALDGGAAYLERRRLQNTADAVAVSGARLLIMTDQPSVDDDDVTDAMDDYAQGNGIAAPESWFRASYVDQDTTVLAEVGAGTVPDHATGISVTVRSEQPTWFMRLVGIATAPVSALSVAQTGPPDMSVGAIPDGGLRPFGVPVEIFDDLNDGDEFTICFDNKCDKESSACTIEYTVDGENRSHAHRGWWNYNEIGSEQCSSTGGASDLKEWMANGWNGDKLFEDDEVCSKPGVNASVFGEAPTDEDVYIPVYDCFADGRYHVDGFAAIRILEAVNKCITARFVLKTEAQIHGQADPGAEVSYHTKMVTLWQ